MKQRLLIVLFTALVFGAGYGAHMWFGDDTAVPPPPAAIGSEFAHGPGTPAVTAATDSKNTKRSNAPFDRAKMMAEIQRYSSQIKTYQASLDRIDAEFDQGLKPLFTDDQRTRYAALQKRWADRRAKGEAAIAAETTPLSDEQIFRLQRAPLYGVLSSVSVTMRFDQLKKDLKLADSQDAKVRELLVIRRERFLALIDATPPPSITLSQLALHAAKLGADPEKPAPAK